MAVMAAATLTLGLAACTNASTGTDSSPSAAAPSDPARAAQIDQIVAVVEQAIADQSLGAVIVQVQIGDEVLMTEAFGESITGVPATTDMHFRNGAVAFQYVTNLLLQYVDDEIVTLDDTIDEWVPELPDSDSVTLRMLTNQTSGYPDFETDPGWNAAYNDDPFHEFTYQERIDYAFSRPSQFEPGTNWSYAHTNFMILGHILEMVGGAPLDQLLQETVLTPMGLTETASYASAFIPEPVLHSFSSERRAPLGIADDVAFLEESTFWNPAWGTPVGAAQTTTIGDMTKTAIAIGTGALLSEESFHEMTDSQLIGFGEQLDVCAPSCFTQVDGYNYGLGVVRSGDWILQNPLLSGYSAAEAYLPSQRIAISVANTFAAGAFSSDGAYANASDALFRQIGAIVAPGDAPPTHKK